MIGWLSVKCVYRARARARVCVCMCTSACVHVCVWINAFMYYWGVCMSNIVFYHLLFVDYFTTSHWRVKECVLARACTRVFVYMCRCVRVCVCVIKECVSLICIYLLWYFSVHVCARRARARVCMRMSAGLIFYSFYIFNSSYLISPAKLK